MNVTLRQLRAFVAVARTGSFTLAAESLFITQSALSGLIKELEQALGLRLFDRSTRRLQLSDAGSDLVTHIEKILLDLDGVIDEVGKLKALQRSYERPRTAVGNRYLFATLNLDRNVGNPQHKKSIEQMLYRL